MHPSDRFRNTRLARAAVLVNAKTATKTGFLKNCISGFMEPGSVESSNTRSSQEAGAICSEKLSLHVAPALSPRKK